MGFFDKFTKYLFIRVNWEGGDKAISGMALLKKAAGTLITAYAAKQVFDFTTKLIRMGAEAQQVEKNFNKMTQGIGVNAAQFNKDLSRATMGLVENTKLQKMAINAMLSGIKTQDLVTTMQYATNYALATGNDVEQVFTSMVESLQRGITRGLKPFGITAKDTAGALVEMKLKMNSFSSKMDVSTIATKQAGAAWEELLETVGKILKMPLDAYFKNTHIAAMDALAAAELEVKRLDALQSKMLGDPRHNAPRTDRALEAELQAAIKYRDAMRGVYADKAADEAKKKGESTYQPRELSDNAIKAIQESRQKAKEETRKANEDAAQQAKEHEARMIEIGKKGYEDYMKMEDEDGMARVKKQEALEKSGEEIRKELLQESLAGRLQLLQEEAEKEIAIYDALHMDTSAITAKFNKLKDIAIKEQADKEQEAADNAVKIERDKIDAIKNQWDGWLNVASNFNSGLMALSDARTQQELRNLDKQHLSQRQYERKKDQILKEAAIKERMYARVQQSIVLAETIVNVASWVVKAAAKSSNAYEAIANAIVAGAMGAVQIATIQAQHFQTGGLAGRTQGYRGRDDIPAMIGNGEYVMPAPQTAQNLQLLESIRNNTANTAGAIGRARGGANYQFYGASTEQITEIIKEDKRRNRTGLRI